MARATEAARQEREALAIRDAETTIRIAKELDVERLAVARARGVATIDRLAELTRLAEIDVASARAAERETEIAEAELIAARAELERARLDAETSRVLGARRVTGTRKARERDTQTIQGAEIAAQAVRDVETQAMIV